MRNIFLARLKQGKEFNIGLCRHYTHQNRDLFVCKFLTNDGYLLDVTAVPEIMEFAECKSYKCSISMSREAADHFWDVYLVYDKKGILEENCLTIGDGQAIEFDRNLNLWDSLCRRLKKEQAKQLKVPEVVIEHIIP